MYIKASSVEWPALNPNCFSEIRLYTYFQIAEFKSLSITLLVKLISDTGS